MLNRRDFLTIASVAAGATLIEKSVCASASGTNQDLTRYVNVFIGTGGHGHCYPGATVPFGAVQLSPESLLS